MHTVFIIIIILLLAAVGFTFYRLGWKAGSAALVALIAGLWMAGVDAIHALAQFFGLLF